MPIQESRRMKGEMEVRLLAKINALQWMVNEFKAR